MKSLPFLAAVIAALVGLAVAAGYSTATANHDEVPFSGTLTQHQFFMVSGSGCHWISLGGDLYLHNQNNEPVLDCTWAPEASIKRFQAIPGIEVVTNGGAIYSLLTGHAGLSPVLVGATNPFAPELHIFTQGDVRIMRLWLCSRNPAMSLHSPLWDSGSIWCQQLAGSPPTASFSTE